MSRFYEMAMEVSGIAKGKNQKIHHAVEEEWAVELFDFRKQSASFVGQGSLSGGESEDEFAERVAHSIWKANGAYCKVQVKATYLEELPFEMHAFDHKDYERFRRAVKPNRSKSEK